LRYIGSKGSSEIMDICSRIWKK